MSQSQKKRLLVAINIDDKSIELAHVQRGFGAWSFYFLAKIALYWSGFINFDVFYNFVFAGFLLIPLRQKSLHVLRSLLAFPAAVALLYYDSWLPPIKRLIEQPEIFQFTNEYLLELLLRFVNWHLLGVGLIVIIIYSMLAQWLRMTSWALLALLLVALSNIPSMPRLSWADTSGNNIAQNLNVTPLATEPRIGDIDSLLNQELESFYQNEKKRTTQFSLPNIDAAKFDLLVINVCSLAWSDLEVSQLEQHPVFAKMNIMFDNFNTATSYSGPAVLRLMRASCGQPAHDALYKQADQQCYLFENLKQLGFSDSSALNHTGEFEGFIDQLSFAGITSSPLIPKVIRPTLKAFDGTPIWGDYDTLKLWWTARLNTKAPAAALLYNTITLHDGNREATADGGSRSSPYAKRAKKLLDDLDIFMTELEASGRQVMLVFVPEHGAALEGDRMQISGMREIPTLEITHVPVGVRFIGMESIAPRETLHISTPSSYFALSELVARVLSRDTFEQSQVDWQALISDLPETQAVSENSGTVMMQHQGDSYIRLGNRDWVKYVR